MAGRLTPAPRAAWPRAAILVAGVLAAHVLALEWLAGQWMPVRPVQRMADVMFTRTLAPAEPSAIAVAAPPPPRARPRPALRQVEPAQAVKAGEPPATPPAAPPAAADTDTQASQTTPDASTAPATPSLAVTVAQAAPAPQATPAPAPSFTPMPTPTVAALPGGGTPTSGSTSAASGTTTAAALDGWPPDTRLRYRLTGFWRGDITGAAHVQWQRQVERYQVEILIDLGLVSARMISQGKVTARRLEPDIYEELMPGGRRRPIEFRPTQIRLADGEIRERPEAVQDTASQFVEMAYRFSRDPALLRPGSAVRLTMARPGGIDNWVYDVGEPETIDLRLDHVHTPVMAYRLVPRPLPGRENYIYQQVWFSPQLQNLPVRIRVDLGDHKGHVQLDVIGIDQR